MELGKRIRQYRQSLSWNQDELAEKMYVSRQTISNWENDKSYPDIHSLLLLGNLFDVSLDQLVKGDVEMMEEMIDRKEIKKLDYYGKIFTVHLLITVLSCVPFFLWLEFYAIIPVGVLWAVSMYWALKVEKIKKTNNVQTYKEIIAFSKGETLDEINRQREIGKRPYQKGLAVIVSALVAVTFYSVMLLIVWLIKRVL